MGKADAQPTAPLTARRTPASLSLAVVAGVGSVLGTGFIPVAPATFASLVTLALVWALPKSLTVYLPVLLALLLLGVFCAAWLERRWGKDSRRITIDELVGMLVTFLLVPFSLLSALLGFLLFRFFDIIKLPFVRALERIPNGWGVMLDDVAAGVCANLVLQILFRLLWPATRGQVWSLPG